VSVGNALLKMTLRRAKADKSLKIAIQEGSCGEEFTILAHEQRRRFDVCLERSAAYLNWRYLENPLAHHEIVTARREGCLVGYIVWTQSRDDAFIVDLFGEQDRGMVRSLISEVAICAREKGVMTLSVSVNESHPWRSVFCEMGFRERESFPVVIIPSKNCTHKIDPELKGWYLMQGDRDS
jgi:hypothetical protein